MYLAIAVAVATLTIFGFFSINPFRWVKFKASQLWYVMAAVYWLQMVFTWGPFILPYNDAALQAEGLGFVLLYLAGLGARNK